MTRSIQDLREQRKAKAVETRKLVDDNPGDKWTAEHQAKYDALVADIDRLDAEIERVQKVIDLDAQNAARIQRRADENNISTDEAEHRLNQEKAVFVSWLRGGVDALTTEQRQFVAERRRQTQIQGAMSTTTPSEGGYLVPTDFAATLLEEMKAFGGMRSVATVIRTDNGVDIEWPTVDATSQEGEIVAENATVTTQEVTFGVKTLGAFKYSSKDIAVPFELLQDSRIDLEAYIRRLLAERIARITNRHFTVGAGTTEPQGAVTASAQGKVGANGQTTSVTYDDLVDLEHSVDPAYRESGSVRWMFHDQTLKVLKKLKDADDRPLWLPGISSGEPATILNYPYTINQNMPQMAANAKSILFGDFSKYMIRDVMSVMLFRMTDSAFTRKGQVGFLAFSRHDGALIDASNAAIKHYQNAAS
jgi:HK97 family phage major capsid protein